MSDSTREKLTGGVSDPRVRTSAFVGTCFHPSGDAVRIATTALYRSTTLDRSTVNVSELGLYTHVD